MRLPTSSPDLVLRPTSESAAASTSSTSSAANSSSSSGSTQARFVVGIVEQVGRELLLQPLLDNVALFSFVVNSCTCPCCVSPFLSQYAWYALIAATERCFDGSLDACFGRIIRITRPMRCRIAASRCDRVAYNAAHHAHPR